MSDPTRSEQTLLATVRTAEVLSQLGIDSALIGALALAAHGYTRATEDADLATDVDPFTQMRKAVRALQEAGFDAELVTPDADDSLGGVITISGDDFDPVQIVNFYNPLRPGSINPGSESVRQATPYQVVGGSLRVVDLPHLIALKLYAGGPKSQLDVVELLARNPKADLSVIRAVCERFGLDSSFDKLQEQLHDGG